MARTSLPLTDELHAYLVAHGSPPDEIAQDLIDETVALLPAEAALAIARGDGARRSVDRSGHLRGVHLGGPPVLGQGGRRGSDRVELVLLPIADGLTLARRR